MSIYSLIPALIQGGSCGSSDPLSNLWNAVVPSPIDSTGTIDSAASIQTACTTAGNAGGGYVCIPPGTYKCNTTISVPTGVTIAGSGYAATTLNNQAVGDFITMDSTHHSCLTQMTISSSSVRSAGYAVRVSGGDTSVKLGPYNISRAQHVIDVDLNNQYDGVLIEDKSATNGNWGTTVGNPFRMAIWRNFAAGRYPYTCNTPHGATQVLQRIFIYGNATPANGPQGFRVLGAGDLTISKISTWGTLNGLLMDVDGIGAESVMEVKVENSYIDFARNDCFRFNPATGVPGQAPILVQFSNTWFATSQTANCAYGSNGTGHKVLFTGCQFLNAANYGIKGDTGCTSSTFAVVDNTCDFGPPLSNASGTTNYT